MMDDLISRQAAIDALEREQSLVERPITETRWFDLGLRKAQDVLSELPSEQPTLYGYRLEHLAMIATVMRRENVTPEKVIEILTDVGKVGAMYLKEQEQIFSEVLERWGSQWKTDMRGESDATD